LKQTICHERKHYVIQQRDYLAGVLNRYISFIYTYVQSLPQKLFSSVKKPALQQKDLKFMNTVQVIGIIAGACTSISLLPQLIKTIKEKKDGDISYLCLAFY